MYGEFAALKGVNFEIEPCEFFALLGPSGSGNRPRCEFWRGWTRRRRAACLSTVRILQPRTRATPIAMVFQSYALYPHMTVY